MTRSRLLLVAIAAVIVASVGFFLWRRTTLAGGSRSTPVILISIDTLRSDHLPAYGYTAVSTPNIDALRADSILYERAYSHVPLTLPSHTSILTGMLPGDHGVRDNVGFRLADSVPTVQELLKKNGYATGAAVSAYVLRHETGIARGFDFYDDQVEPLGPSKVIGRVQRAGGETLQAATSWLDAHSSRPFFFFLHLYDPHTPYNAPEPFFSRYANKYDGEIAYADSVVGDLIQRLKQTGVYDRALIVLLSDHGEGLNEHGEEEHGIFLYREDLQVPLIVKLPRSSQHGATVKTPVELVDIFPTILQQTATPLPAGHRVGESLLTFVKGGQERPIYAETFYPRFHFGWSDLHSLIQGNEHFIRAPQAELYDLGSDPGEKKNVLEQDRRTYVRMRETIEPFVREAAAPSNIDPEDAAKLAALGYVGSTVDTHAGANLPDPKTTIGVFNQIRQAYTWFRNGKEDDALRLTDQLLANNSQITDLWDLKFNIYDKVGKKTEAVEAAKEGLRHTPTSIALLFDVATGALALDDYKTAKEHAEIAMKMEPGRAHEILGRIYAAQGDRTHAVQEEKAAVGSMSDPSPALITLASLAKDGGDLNGALQYLDQVAERASHRRSDRVPDLHLNRGDVLARLGRNEEAEREFRSEITAYPADPRAYTSLILLLTSERRVQEATGLIYDTIKAAPQPHSYALISDTLKALGDEQGALYWAVEGIKKYPQDPELRRLPVLARFIR
ncbi:MAG TPA: sulfatase-like hydrolase/transferase [Thermoanaerobaculia bacterium]|jgi:arylsulfatase A-like enzyme